MGSFLGRVGGQCTTCLYCSLNSDTPGALPSCSATLCSWKKKGSSSRKKGSSSRKKGRSRSTGSTRKMTAVANGQHSGGMKMMTWCLYILALLLVLTTTVVDCKTVVARFNASQGSQYMEFFTPAHDEIKLYPGSEDDGFHVRLPETPKDFNVPPIGWVMLWLYSGGSPSPKAFTYMRVDSLYTLGFANVDGMIHYNPAYPNFFTGNGKMPLPFSESYADLTNTPPGEAVYPKLAQVQIGRAAAELAVETLSTYRGVTATTNVESVKHAYLTIIIMTSEALRIKAVREAWRIAWENTGTITELDAQYMMAWSGLSVLYPTNDLGQLNPAQLRKVKRVGITTAQDAGNTIDLVYRSKD